MKESIKKFFKDNLITIIIVLAVIICAIVSVKSCQKEKEDRETQQHNIEALNDSIHYWKTISGQAVAEKKILIGDLDLLKIANDSLYNKVKELEVKKPSSVVYIKTEVVREKHDTAWIKNDSIKKYDFDFSDKWRELSGSVAYNDSTIKMSVDKDIVNLDYIVAIENGKAKVSSSNPYVKMTEIQGIEIKQPKKKKFHIGPYAGIGTGIHDNKVIVTPEVGIGITYSIFGF